MSFNHRLTHTHVQLCIDAELVDEKAMCMGGDCVSASKHGEEPWASDGSCWAAVPSTVAFSGVLFMESVCSCTHFGYWLFWVHDYDCRASQGQHDAGVRLEGETLRKVDSYHTRDGSHLAEGAGLGGRKGGPAAAAASLAFSSLLLCAGAPPRVPKLSRGLGALQSCVLTPQHRHWLICSRMPDAYMHRR